MTFPALNDIGLGDRKVLARAITLSERGDPAIAKLFEGARSGATGAFRVGLSGPPGAGKSSLIRELVRRIRASGERVAVIASDPVSPVSGGALLGDRYRMAGVADDPGVFYRSLAHRGATGELPPAVWKAADLCEAAGFAWIILETVGTGQADVHALRGAQAKVILHAPEAGDEIQMMKAGLQETAQVHVVGKADRPGARAWAAELESVLSLDPSGPGKAFLVSATTGEGVDELLVELRRLRALGKREGASER